METDLLVLIDEEKKLNDHLRKNLNFFNDTCQIPALNFSGEVKTIPSKPCKIKKNPGYIKDNIWHLYDKNNNDNKTPECFYREILRIDDFKTKLGENKPLMDGQKILHEVFEVTCNEKNTRSKFNSVFAQIVSKLNAGNTSVKDESLHKSDKNNCTPLNVMLISYDSVSRVSWVKRLPLTYKYITEAKNFEILNGYNIVGDGTPAGEFLFNYFN